MNAFDRVVVAASARVPSVGPGRRNFPERPPWRGRLFTVGSVSHREHIISPTRAFPVFRDVASWCFRAACRGAVLLPRAMSSELGEGHVSWRGVGCVAAGAVFGFVSKAFERCARARWSMSHPSLFNADADASPDAPARASGTPFAFVTSLGTPISANSSVISARIRRPATATAPAASWWPSAASRAPTPRISSPASTPPRRTPERPSAVHLLRRRHRTTPRATGGAHRRVDPRLADRREHHRRGVRVAPRGRRRARRQPPPRVGVWTTLRRRQDGRLVTRRRPRPFPTRVERRRRGVPHEPRRHEHGHTRPRHATPRTDHSRWRRAHRRRGSDHRTRRRRSGRRVAAPETGGRDEGRVELETAPIKPPRSTGGVHRDAAHVRRVRRRFRRVESRLRRRGPRSSSSASD